jgi:hypothetical protein
MQIGEADDNFFDSQEEDFYYDDYNDDDEEEREVWEDGEEVHLQVPAELLHAPDRRGKKRMRMQRRPYNRGDAEISATAAALFASPPPSPAQSFEAYFQHTTAVAMANRTRNCYACRGVIHRGEQCQRRGAGGQGRELSNAQQHGRCRHFPGRLCQQPDWPAR